MPRFAQECALKRFASREMRDLTCNAMWPDHRKMNGPFLVNRPRTFVALLTASGGFIGEPMPKAGG